MKFSKRSKYLLISLLVLLNIIIRIPSIPHEIGVDSFGIHILANSISTFGIAKWWVNILSIFGLYTEYSYASAVPFILSGISQCTGLEMEHTIWLFCLIIGLFSAFTAYLLAGVLWDDDRFKFLLSFIYSLSAGILAFTWQTSTRGLFIILLPLFMYLLLKTRAPMVRYSLLTFILLVLLMATHHYFLFTIPIIICYAVLLLYNKLKKCINFKKNLKIPGDFANIAFIFFFLVALIYPFVTRLFITTGERWYWLDEMINSNIRYTGVLIIFAVGGFISLSLKRDKRFEEWFFLLVLLCLAPFIYIKTYAYTFFLIFTCVLIGVSLTNVAKAYGHKKKFIAVILIVSLLLAICFSSYYQHWRTGSKKYGAMGGPMSDWYMKDATYRGGLWIKDSISQDKNMVTEGKYGVLRRIFATSEVPTLTGFEYIDLTYGFTTINYSDIIKNSPLTTEFYMDNPYVIDYSKMSSRGEYSLSDYIRYRLTKRSTISKFNFSYAIEDEDRGDGAFIRSVHEKKDNLYNNGKILVWSLE